jgi:uncharacterized protein YaiI (UPF0178 family)
VPKIVAQITTVAHRKGREVQPIRILVDADACPVKQIIESVARNSKLQVIWVASIEHNIDSNYGQVLVVDHAPEAADLCIVNNTQPHDIVVTQDLGLASLVLAKGAQALTPSGKVLDENNMDALLAQRYINKKARRQGYRIGRMAARTALDDREFKQALLDLIDGNDHEN